MLRKLFPVLLLFLLTACGFTLRGNEPGARILPPTQIQGIPAGHPLARALRTQLVVLDTDAAAEAWALTIEDEQWDKRIVSFTSAGEALEYELRYEVSFHFAPISGEQPPLVQQVAVTRDYGFDPGRVLAKSAEEQMVRDAMIEQAAERIIRQLRYNEGVSSSSD